MHTLLVDGSNLLFRAYWVADTRPKFNNSKGVWTGPVYLFLKSLKSIVDKFRPDDVWVVWDKKLNYPCTNYRKRMAPDTYKQNRDNEKTNKVHEQHSILTPWLTTLGVKQMYPWVLEADDIISWLAKEKTQSSTIVTVDKDMLQLIDSNTQYYNPIKKKLITQETFEEEIGVFVNQFVYYKALLGDASDNIKGIDGYGVQKSKRLVAEGYDVILKTLNEDDVKKFLYNIELVDLNKSYTKEKGELECYEKQFKEQNSVKSDIKLFESMCVDFEFYSIIKDLDKWKHSFTRSQHLINLISQLS